MFCQIVEKKFPLRHLPKTGHFVIVETNHECRDQIEFLSKVGQGAESFYPLDYPTDAEKTRDFSKQDRKSTRLNSSHGYISYAVFCLKKKKKQAQLTCY